VRSRYIIKPLADRDLNDYADHLARNASLEVALRFLSAAEETFAMLARQPKMGWPSRLTHAELKSMRTFRVTSFERMLILYRPLDDGVDILRVVHSSRNLQALFRRRGELA